MQHQTQANFGNWWANKGSSLEQNKLFSKSCPKSWEEFKVNNRNNATIRNLSYWPAWVLKWSVQMKYFMGKNEFSQVNISWQNRKIRAEDIAQWESTWQACEWPWVFSQSHKFICGHTWDIRFYWRYLKSACFLMSQSSNKSDYLRRGL